MTQIRTTVGGWLVSTIQLCGNHRHYGTGKPIIYETMILWERDITPQPAGEGFVSLILNPRQPYQARYCTQADAEADHKRVVAALQAGTEPSDITNGSAT